MNSSLPMLAALVEPGKIFAEKYRVEGIIGSGGMGLIVAARHVQLEQRVAIKVMSAVDEDAERLARFTREAKASARIQSDHVVRILDFGTESHGLPFIVMEHLAGEDLGHVVAEGGPLDVEEAIDLILQACEGVAEAHQHGIVHRDIKPANLFLLRKKSGGHMVKVLDFGASKLTGKTSLATGDPLKTDAFAVIGSPSYMAPEQLREGVEIDGRVDVYALGATLFELVAGRPVFVGDSISRIFSKVLWDPPPLLRSLRADAPGALEAIVSKALEKLPADRYENVKAFAAALGALAPERSRPLLDQIERTGLPAKSVAPARAGSRISSPELEATPIVPIVPAVLESEITPQPISQISSDPQPDPLEATEPAIMSLPSPSRSALSPETPLAVTATPLPLPTPVDAQRPPLESDPGDIAVPLGGQPSARLGIMLGAGAALVVVLALGVALARSGSSSDEATTGATIAPTASQIVATPDLSGAKALEVPPVAATATPSSTMLAVPPTSPTPTPRPAARPHAQTAPVAAPASAPANASTAATARPATTHATTGSGNVTDFGTRK